FGEGMEAPLLEQLAAAHSNLPEHGTGRDIYVKWVEPTMIALPQVGAHYAMSSLFTRRGESVPTYCYTVARLDHNQVESGRARLALGRVLVTSRITEEHAHLTYAALHFGDNNVNAGVRVATADEPYAEFVQESRAA